MLYFNSFPKVITTDYKNNSIVLTNLMARTEIIPSLLKNPLIFYSYDMKDSDRPDIIANKYYNDVNKFWLVLYSNQAMDPEYDLVLNSQKFSAYLKAKYPTTDITNTIKEYRKTITTYDASSLTTTSKTIVIDATTYNNTIIGTTTNNFYDSHGNIINSVTQTITLQAITIYQYEIEQNEAKRNIDLINASYSNQIEKDFASLMRL